MHRRNYVDTSKFINIILNAELSFVCPTSSLESEDGVVTVPSGPGLGVTIDPEHINRHQLVTG
jgi:L-alanine-DL-glutamate epimerase-like enolase superfamily enzyme